jgi:hypothetical protein
VQLLRTASAASAHMFWHYECKCLYSSLVCAAAAAAAAAAAYSGTQSLLSAIAVAEAQLSGKLL